MPQQYNHTRLIAVGPTSYILHQPSYKKLGGSVYIKYHGPKVVNITVVTGLRSLHKKRPEDKFGRSVR
jgi:hypothetical protein